MASTKNLSEDTRQMTIGRAPIRPPPGCRFIQGVPDMLLEYPREHALQVLSWFQDWFSEFEFQVQQDLARFPNQAAGPEMSDEARENERLRIENNARLLGGGFQHTQPHAGYRPEEPVGQITVGPASQPPAIHPDLMRSISKGGQSDKSFGPSSSAVVPIGTAVPGCHWENGLLIRDKQPQPERKKTSVTPMASVGSPVPQPSPIPPGPIGPTAETIPPPPASAPPSSGDLPITPSEPL